MEYMRDSCWGIRIPPLLLVQVPVTGDRADDKIDHDARTVVCGHLRGIVDLQQIVAVPTHFVGVTRGRKADLIVEEAQAGLIVMDELVVDLVLGLPKLFHRALEISPRDVVVAEHLTVAGDDDLPILHRVLRESILIDLVTNGLLLPLSETLDDLLLVLL